MKPRDLRDAKEDHRPRLRGWAPGSYICECHKCEATFLGDKRAIECADCAYDGYPPEEPNRNPFTVIG